jgi:plastocyanin
MNQKNKWTTIFLILTTLVLILASCSPMNNSPDGETQDMPPTEEKMTNTPAEEDDMEMDEAEVIMQSNTYQPAEMTVSVGTTVTWVNEDSFDHTITAGTRGEPSGLFDATVAAGGNFSYTFEEAGTYDYYCTIHPGMNGTIIVE